MTTTSDCPAPPCGPMEGLLWFGAAMFTVLLVGLSVI